MGVRRGKIVDNSTDRHFAIKEAVHHQSSLSHICINLRVKVLRPTRHKIGHFGDVLPSQSLGVVLKKLNLTQQKQTTKQNGPS